VPSVAIAEGYESPDAIVAGEPPDVGTLVMDPPSSDPAELAQNTWLVSTASPAG
jgi:hypothetical protein